MTGSGDELFLIDGNSLVYRAFFALPESIASQPSVQNIVKTVQSMVHLDKTWIKK